MQKYCYSYSLTHSQLAFTWSKNLPVFLAMFSSSSGYLVSLCISIGMMSFSCSLRHWGLLSASWNLNTHLHQYLQSIMIRLHCACFTLCQLYQNEGIEARLFLLPALDLIQSPWLVTAKPGGQFLEPLPLRTLKLKKTDVHASQRHTGPH